MIKVDEIYEELDFLGKEQMVLFNPSNRLEQPCFFIKESEAIIEALIDKKYLDFQIRYFTLGRVTPYLFFLIFDEKEYDIYGHWINVHSKEQRKRYIEMNFKEYIYIAFIDSNNQVKHVDAYENPLRGRIGELFSKENCKIKWSQQDFEGTVKECTYDYTRKSFFKEALQE